MPGVVFPEPDVGHVRIKRRTLPAVWMRAGTSKGLYLHRRDLPANPDAWAPIVSRVMGSYDADAKQLNGIGGATSTTSKVAVVSRSARPGADVDYTFVQVPLSGANLDMTGNCGNIASGVGPFAVDEGLVKVGKGQKEVQVRVFNTNTNSLMIETVQVDDDGHFQEGGEYMLPGLQSKGSPVKMAFSRPSGSMTGRLLPSGNAKDVILMQTAMNLPPEPVVVSLVDAANPFVFVDAASLPAFYDEEGPGSPPSLALVESIRRQAAVMMGLASTVEEAALTRGTPKIAVLSQPAKSESSLHLDIHCLSYSMGRVHGSLQLTGAVCLASAACVEGTVAWDIRSRSRTEAGTYCQPLHRAGLERVNILHSGGRMEVDLQLDGLNIPEEVTVFRTARRLMEGNVYYLA